MCLSPLSIGKGSPLQCKAFPHGNWRYSWEKADAKNAEDLLTNSPTVSPIKSSRKEARAPPFLPQPKSVLEEINKRLDVAGANSPSQIYA